MKRTLKFLKEFCEEILEERCDEADKKTVQKFLDDFVKEYSKQKRFLGKSHPLKLAQAFAPLYISISFLIADESGDLSNQRYFSDLNYYSNRLFNPSELEKVKYEVAVYAKRIVQ